MCFCANNKIVKAIQAGDKKIAKKQYDENISLIDRIADKKIIHIREVQNICGIIV